MTKVHLIDGTFELFRAYYAAPSMRNSRKQEVGAVRVFLRSLNVFLQRPEVTHVAIAFDTVIESFRNDLFAGYKTGEGMDPDLWRQFPLVEEAAAALGVQVWSMIDYEADDGLAAGAHKFSRLASVRQVILCSPDKDLMQCVRGKRIVCWDRLRDCTYDETGVKKKFGIAPESIPDYLALVGDPADGIPGLPKWGAKSSSTLLAKYKHLENIPTDSARWKVKLRGAQGLSAVLNEYWEEVQLFRKLATLRKDAPIAGGLRDLKWRGAARPALAKLCARLDDGRFLKQSNVIYA